MHKFIILLFSFFIFQASAQSKKDYLEDNRFDLHSPGFDFPQKHFMILGFGAYHGSAKTEEVELNLLQSLTKDGTINYYFPEVDYSTAHFFNQYLLSGDTILLKELIMYNGIHTPQERTIEVYNKWKKLKDLNDSLPENHRFKVLGIEWIRNYKYVSKHLLELAPDPNGELIPIQEIKKMVELDTTSYARGDLSFAHQKLKDLEEDYRSNPKQYLSQIKDPQLFDFILNNIKSSLEAKPEREQIMYENYLALDSIYDFRSKPQFIRVGFFHLEKSREGKEGYPYFFARLIENNIYPREQVLSVIGFLTESKVVWDETYDETGNYTGYTEEAGYGIGDYEKEYFRGIQHLKDSKISDQTLYRLNKPNSPYELKEPDLVEIIMTDDPSNGEAVKGMSTLDFLDYAVLISGSKASVPIYELHSGIKE